MAMKRLNSAPHIDLQLHPEAEGDLQKLHDLHLKAQPGPRFRTHDRMFGVAMNTIEQLAEINNGYPPKRHPLGRLSTYPDLSDHQKIYLGTDTEASPEYRMVIKETPPPDPTRDPGPENKITRQIIAIGPRENGAVYHSTGPRLNRPIGVAIEDLQEHHDKLETVRNRASLAPIGAGRAGPDRGIEY